MRRKWEPKMMENLNAECTVVIVYRFLVRKIRLSQDNDPCNQPLTIF